MRCLLIAVWLRVAYGLGLAPLPSFCLLGVRGWRGLIALLRLLCLLGLPVSLDVRGMLGFVFLLALLGSRLSYYLRITLTG